MDNSKVNLSIPETLDKSVEKPATSVQVEVVDLEALTEEEVRLRLELENEVEESFFRAGCALKTLRDERLYRSTHVNFSDYCVERFGYSRRQADYLISASSIYENIKMRTICSHEVEKEMRTICSHPLPTKESQVRPLANLLPEEQVRAWEQAVWEAGNKVPTARVVQDVVQRIMEKNQVPNPYRIGEVCQILVKQNPDLRGRGGEWCIIKEVLNFSCIVRVWDGEIQVPIQNLKDCEYSIEQREKVHALCDRLNGLARGYGEKTVRALLEQLAKSTSPYLLPIEDRILKVLESELQVQSIEKGIERQESSVRGR